jgi:hypothetical protein
VIKRNIKHQRESIDHQARQSASLVIVQDDIRDALLLVESLHDFVRQLASGVCRVEERHRLHDVDEPQIPRKRNTAVCFALSLTTIVRLCQRLDCNRSAASIIEQCLQHGWLESVVVALSCIKSCQGSVVFDEIVTTHIEQVRGTVWAEYLSQRPCD